MMQLSCKVTIFFPYLQKKCLGLEIELSNKKYNIVNDTISLPFP